MIYSLFSTSGFVCMNDWLEVQSSESFIRQSCSTFTGLSVPVKSTWGNNTILIHIHSLTHPPLADHWQMQISFQISRFSSPSLDIFLATGGPLLSLHIHTPTIYAQRWIQIKHSLSPMGHMLGISPHCFPHQHMELCMLNKGIYDCFPPTFNEHNCVKKKHAKLLYLATVTFHLFINAF